MFHATQTDANAQILIDNIDNIHVDNTLNFEYW